MTRPALVLGEPRSGALPLKLTKNKIDYEFVSFNRLFFHYQPPVNVEQSDGNFIRAAKDPMSIPKEILELNGKKIAIKGFVIPLANSGQYIQEFLFADSLVTCMFCAMMGYDQWMIVKTVDPKGFRWRENQYEKPVTIYGTFEVGPEFENGQFTSLYRFKADGFIRKKL